jgi:predicted nucleic acid-binding protein
MRVVVDANVLAAALLRPSGWSARQLRRDDLELVVPATLVEDLAPHAETLADKAGMDVDAWHAAVRDLMARVRVVPVADLVRWDAHDPVAEVRSLDADDAPYFAALLAADADAVWTRDRLLLDWPGVCVQAVPAAHAAPAPGPQEGEPTRRR